MPSILQGRNKMSEKPMGMKTAPPDMHKPEHDVNTSVASTTLHDHGDGTFHTESEDGERTEHPHIGHALMHMAGKHDGGMHHMTSSDGMGDMKSHSTMGGEVDGPHDYQNIEQAKNALSQFFNEEESEGDHMPREDASYEKSGDY